MSLENSNKLQCLINHIFPMPSEIGTLSVLWLQSAIDKTQQR